MSDEKKPVEKEEAASPSPAFDAILKENEQLKADKAALIHEQKELLNRLAAKTASAPAEDRQPKFSIRGGKIIER